jgi:hypothetical protein
MKAVIKGWVHLDTSKNVEDEDQFVFFAFETKNYGYMPLFAHSFEFELPAGFSRVAAESEAIKAQMAQAAADYHATVQKLQERLSKLQAIEYTEAA